ncbi:MAG: hypothetical protein SV760_07425, partial [Halobacteria archaeon]|nr:hypothetical protein [Halobacteria archaeon]
MSGTRQIEGIEPVDCESILSSKEWYEKERSYDDEVIGESPVPELLIESWERNSEKSAQMYKGGIHDRSLTDGALSPAPEGEYTSITYDEMGSIVRNL